MKKFSRRAAFSMMVLGTALLSGCQFEPLHGNTSSSTAQLSDVTVGAVTTRVGLQVRNRLLFLLNGGNAPLSPKYRADLRVRPVIKTLATTQSAQDRTAGQAIVIVNYELFDVSTNKSIARGSRQASASYDRTSQSFANLRAQRDAENRASVEAAELIRLAIASDLNK